MLLGLCAWALVSSLPFLYIRFEEVFVLVLEYTDIADDRTHGSTR